MISSRITDDAEDGITFLIRAPSFYGLMGMCYTSPSVPKLRDHLRENSFENTDGTTRLPADLLLAELFEEIPIFNTRFDLVDHIGDVSQVSPGSGLRSRSATFNAGLSNWRLKREKTLTVIVPFRDRDEHLKEFVPALRKTFGR